MGNSGMTLNDINPYSSTKQRELLYTMNGKPVYEDELRPIGESLTTRIDWKGLYYVACVLVGSLLAIWIGWGI